MTVLAKHYIASTHHVTLLQDSIGREAKHGVLLHVLPSHEVIRSLHLPSVLFTQVFEAKRRVVWVSYAAIGLPDVLGNNEIGWQGYQPVIVIQRVSNEVQ